MSAFQTETLSEELKIAFFSESERLFTTFRQTLSLDGIELVWIQSTPKAMGDFFENRLSEQWYKLIWFDLEKSVNLEKAKLFLQIISIVKKPSFILMHQPFYLKNFPTWSQIGQELSEVYRYFNQRSPYTSFLTYSQVISTQLRCVVKEVISQALTRREYDNSITAIGFVTEKELLKSMMHEILNPRGGQRKTVLSDHVLLKKEFFSLLRNHYKKEFHQELLVKEGSELTLHPDFKPIKISSTLSTQEVLAELLKTTTAPEVIPSPIVESKFSLNFSLPKPHLTTPLDAHNPQMITNDLSTDPDQFSEKITRLSTSIQKKIPQRSGPLIERATTPTKPHSILESDIRVRVTTHQLVERKQVLIPSVVSPSINRSKLVLQQIQSNIDQPKETQELTHQRTSKATHSKHLIHHLAQKTQTLKNLPDVDSKKLLEEKIHSLFGVASPVLKSSKNRRKVQPRQLVTQLFGKNSKVLTKNQKRQRLGVFFISSVLVTSSVLFGSFFSTQFLLKRQLTQAVTQQVQLDRVEQDVISRTVFFANLLEKQTLVYAAILGESGFASVSEEIELAKQITSLHERLEYVHQAARTAAAQILSVREGSAFETLTPVVGELNELYKDVSLLEAKLKDQDSLVLGQYLTEDQLKELTHSLYEIRRELLIAQQIIDASPSIFGQQSRKTYVLALQDSQELRGSGGFIDAIVVLHFEDGKLSHTQYYNPEEIDSSLAGVVTPPEDLKKYLREDQWFLRDASWNPDIPQAARQIELFVEKGLSINVDGVITLNTYSLQELVSLSSPLIVEKLNEEKITDKNLQERANTFARNSLQNTSEDQRVSFHAAVSQALSDSILDDEQKVTQLIQKSAGLLRQSELHIMMNDPSAASIFGTLGWAGEIMAPNCPAQLVEDQCLVGRVFQVDSNVGVNKANYFMKKKVEHQIDLQSSKTKHLRTITYENSSINSSWPGGVYKNYVRFYLPRNTLVTRLIVDGKPISPEQTSQYEEKNSLVVTAFIQVVPQSISKLEIEYEEAAVQKPASYAFFNQKQAGTGNTPTTIRMKYYDGLIPTLIAPEAEIEGEDIVFSFFGGEHSFAGVKFK